LLELWDELEKEEIQDSSVDTFFEEIFVPCGESVTQVITPVQRTAYGTQFIYLLFIFLASSVPHSTKK
jgi:hypothetical protein